MQGDKLCSDWDINVQYDLARKLSASPHGETFAVHLACIIDRRLKSRTTQQQWDIIYRETDRFIVRLQHVLKYVWSFAYQSDVCQALEASMNHATLMWLKEQSSEGTENDRALQFLKIKRAIEQKLYDLRGLVSYFRLPASFGVAGSMDKIWPLLQQNGHFTMTHVEPMIEYLEGIDFDPSTICLLRAYSRAVNGPSRVDIEKAKMTEGASPFAVALSQSKGMSAMTFDTFLHKDTLSYFRKSICLAMDDSEGWFVLLKRRNLLGGQGMEQYVSRLKSEWANGRRGEPTLSVLEELYRHDRDFAQMPLAEFCTLLTSLNIPSVQVETVKLTTWLDEQTNKTRAASETTFNASQGLRAWLVKNGICDETQVDALIARLRQSGVESVETIQGFDKDDLKECGFNTVQAIKTIKALEAKK